MRSGTELLPLVLLAAVGCGDYSNDELGRFREDQAYRAEDEAFQAALPTADVLRVALPIPTVQPTCGTEGRAVMWTGAGSAAEGMNQGLSWMLEKVNAARGTSASARNGEERIWGLSDGARIRMTRSVQTGGVAFDYALESRSILDTYQPRIDGRLEGASPAAGTGALSAHASALSTSSTEEGLTDDVDLAYDRRARPFATSLDLTGDDFGLKRGRYGWEAAADGSGTLQFAMSTQLSLGVNVSVRFDAQGRGRGRAVERSGFTDMVAEECWDAGGCRVWVNDPDELLGFCFGEECFVGSESACPQF